MLAIGISTSGQGGGGGSVLLFGGFLAYMGSSILFYILYFSLK
jgi:hypothetical protein